MTASYLEQTSKLLEPLLSQAVHAASDAPAQLIEAVAYGSLDGGKRLRPALVRASGECCQVAPERLEPLMVAVELMHCFSLVHDDLPCMDDDDLRRGRPSTHAQYDESTALLAGDALIVNAFEYVLNCQQLSASEKVNTLSELAAAIGSAGMIGGQFLDMQYLGKSLDARTLGDIHRRKTGALIRCSCLLPTLLMDADDGRARVCREQMNKFGEDLGVGFQVVDDILDVSSSSAKLGKPAGSDIERGHFTYTTLLGLDGSRAEAEKRRGSALSALEVFGEHATPLRELVALIFGRIDNDEIVMSA